MRRKFEIDYEGYVVGPEPDEDGEGVYVTYEQRGIVGIAIGEAATVEVANRPPTARAWEWTLLEFDGTKSYIHMYTGDVTWCVDGLVRAGIVPKDGGKLWVRRVK